MNLYENVPRYLLVIRYVLNQSFDVPKMSIFVSKDVVNEIKSLFYNPRPMLNPLPFVGH